MSIRSLKLACAAVAVAALAGTARADLIITEIVDGSMSGGQPKWVEITNTGNTTVDISNFRLAHYNNGHTVADNELLLGPAMLAPGASWVVNFPGTINPGAYNTAYGTNPDQEDLFFGGHNGDDAVAILDGANNVVDVYGVIGVDGTATVWEYLDSYAYRCTSTASSTFNPAEWIFGGIDALDGDATGCDAVCKLQTLTTPGVKQPCGGGGNVSTYCTPKTTSSGCVPDISWTGTPSPAGSFAIQCSQVEPVSLGVLIYGVNGPAAQPFQGGFLCVVPPIKRLPAQSSAGSGTCTGIYVYDFSAVYASGNDPDLVQGQIVWAQFWFRDPGAMTGSGLSGGIEFTLL